MSSKKSAGKSGGGSQGNTGKSAPKPNPQGMSGGKPSSPGMSGPKPSNSVDTKSPRETQESIKGSSGKGNASGVKLQEVVADNKAGKVEVRSEGRVGSVKSKLSDLKSRGKGNASGQQEVVADNRAGKVEVRSEGRVPLGGESSDLKSRGKLNEPN